MSPSPVPLVILTGFLGAGKTTVLNRVLGAQHHRRVGVIVNELGRIDVDARLLKQRAGDVVELAGGCVCHEVRTMQELWEGLEEILRRSRPDCLVLETTGIAEPSPLLEGLAEHPLYGQAIVASRVVTVVDAQAGVATLARHAEARAQVETADRILLSKIDLASAAELGALHRVLDDLNPAAERASFPPGANGTGALVPWLLDKLVPRTEREDGGSLRPHRHGQLSVVALTEEAPLVGEPLLALCGRLGSTLIRAKGLVRLAGDPRPAFLERAGSQLSLRMGEVWPDGRRCTEIVLIGEGLDAAALERQLWACRAPGQSDA